MTILVQTTGKKLGSTQKFNQNGVRLPVTTISVSSTEGFKTGDLLKVSGISKGKGFAGVVKRHGFRGGPHTHGQSDRERHAGSIGQTTTPGRVYKGKKMAGRMGGAKVTIKGIVLMDIDVKEKIMIVKGLVPGQVKGQIVLTKYSEVKKFIPLLEENKNAEILPDEEKIKEQEAQQAAQAEKVQENTEEEQSKSENKNTEGGENA